MWFTSLTFGFSSTTLTFNQLDSIQQPMMNAILPKMGYSSKITRDIVFGPNKRFSSTTLTFNQLDSIQQPMMNTILPKMGYSSKTARDIVFGPNKYLGIRLQHLGYEHSSEPSGSPLPS
jgi:hypothetical protein